MNKVLVFTNKNSWRGISDKIRDRVEWNSYPNGNDPIMECSSGVYLVYDSIDDIHLNQFFDVCSNDHENSLNCLYNPIFDIITDKEGDKQNRIIKSFFVKNAILVLVNECNVPRNMNPNESNVFRAIYQMEEFRKELEEFAKKYEASEKLIDYKEDLERLQNRIRNC